MEREKPTFDIPALNRNAFPAAGLSMPLQKTLA